MTGSPCRGALQGRSVLVAASAEKAGFLRSDLERRGARVTLLPAIALRALTPDALEEAVARLESYDWIVFTSSHGVAFFLEVLDARGVARSRLAARAICAVGPATGQALREAGVAASLVAEEFRAEGVLAVLAARHGGLAGLAGRRILLPGALERREVLEASLARAGARVEAVACYETVLPEVDAALVAALRAATPEVVVFTSGSTARNFVRLLGPDDGLRLLRSATVAAIGPTTAGVLRALGKEPEIVPRESTTKALAAAVEDFFSR